jgi:ribonuclease HI
MYYSVFKGFNKGIYRSWKECEREVKGYRGAIYKKFKSEIEAIEFLNNGKLKDDKSNFLKVYTDGSCINNGKEGSKGGIGIYFGDGDSRNVSKSLEYDKVTNNVAELSALNEALDILVEYDSDTIIYTDSKYVILCCTSYGRKQSVKNWIDDIPNKDLVKLVYNKFISKENIRLEYVRGHNNCHGNDMADKLAREGINYN